MKIIWICKFILGIIKKRFYFTQISVVIFILFLYAWLLGCCVPFAHSHMWLRRVIFHLSNHIVFVLLLCIFNTVSAQVRDGHSINFTVRPVFWNETFLRKPANLWGLCDIGTRSHIRIWIFVLESLHVRMSPAFTLILCVMFLVIWVIIITVHSIVRSHVKRHAVGDEGNVVPFFDVFKGLAKCRFLV